MTKKAADMLFQKTNYNPQDVDVVELHDCFSANELISYEALGLCAPGKAGELIDSGDNTYGGQYVINPSGGLISKGHPLGATGEYTYFLFSQRSKVFFLERFLQLSMFTQFLVVPSMILNCIVFCLGYSSIAELFRFNYGNESDVVC
jgi:hypothetical protein